MGEMPKPPSSAASIGPFHRDVWLRIVRLIEERETLSALVATTPRFDEILAGPGSNAFWERKCREDGLMPEREDVRAALLTQSGFITLRRLWELAPVGRQLLAPNLTLEELQEFTVKALVDNGRVESPPRGSSTENAPSRCFVGGNWNGKRLMVVELARIGLTDWLMDRIRPILRVAEWNGSRADSLTNHTLHAALAPTPEPPKDPHVWKAYARDSPLGDDRWQRAELVLREYAVGARFLVIDSWATGNLAERGSCATSSERDDDDVFGAKFSDAELWVDWPDYAPYSPPETPVPPLALTTEAPTLPPLLLMHSSLKKEKSSKPATGRTNSCRIQ